MPGMSDVPRRWFRFRLRTLLLWTILTAIVLSLYSYWSEYAEQSQRRERELLSPAPGANCTIVLRRELLGLEQMGSQPATISGVANSITGRFVMMNDQWIVLATGSVDGSEQWVPREHVLVLNVTPP